VSARGESSTPDVFPPDGFALGVSARGESSTPDVFPPDGFALGVSARGESSTPDVFPPDGFALGVSARHKSSPDEEIAVQQGSISLNEDSSAAITSSVVLESVLGHGGFATVWSGKWMWSVVAIKVFKAGMSEQMMRKFKLEAKTLRALRHPNICYFFDTGLLNGAPVLVLECARHGHPPPEPSMAALSHGRGPVLPLCCTGVCVLQTSQRWHSRSSLVYPGGQHNGGRNERVHRCLEREPGRAGPLRAHK